MEASQHKPLSAFAPVVLGKYPLSETATWAPVVSVVQNAVLYIGLGYLLLQRWDLLLVIMAVLLLHEAGHYCAMKHYRYADVTLLLLPFIGAFIKGSKAEISQRQSVVILLAGPLPGLLLGILLHYISIGKEWMTGEIPVQFIAQLLVWANFANLLPIYPLDGGQLINRIYFDEEGPLSTLYFYFSMLMISGIAILLQYYFLLLVPALLTVKFIKNRSRSQLEKEIEELGIDAHATYATLTNEGYWKIRSLLIKHVHTWQHINPTAHQYYAHENKIAAEIAALLSPRILLLDASIKLKVIVAIFITTIMLLPWLLNIHFLLWQYLKR